MATYDMTSSATVGVGADSIASLPSKENTNPVRTIEAYLDFTKLVDSGYTLATGDIFQLLEIPAGTYVLNAGAEVMTAFDGTTPTADIDFAGGDDIVDGADLTTTGFAASGTNGMTNRIFDTNATYRAATFDPFISATDTIDVKIISTDSTSGVLRVFAVVIDCNASGAVPTEATRDQLA